VERGGRTPDEFADDGRANRRSFIRRSIVVLAVVSLTAALVSGIVAGAQQATPVATAQTAAGTTAYPASIHEGTCEVLGPVAYPLADVGVPEGGQIVGQPAIPAYMGETTLPDVVLDDLIFGQYVVAIQTSEPGVERVVACGEIGGTLFGDQLLFGLSPNEEGGIAAAVLLTQESDGSLRVTVYVIINAALPTTPTPASPVASPAAQPTEPAGTPAGGEGQAQGGEQTDVTLEMVDIAFNPSEITIPANTDVAIPLPNSGATLHNFSVTDHNNPDVENLGISVDVQPGETHTATVNAPAGDYYFFCNVPGHEAAGMAGTMHVVEQ
jgi:nitrite reductase (NO-forming)